MKHLVSVHYLLIFLKFRKHVSEILLFWKSHNLNYSKTIYISIMPKPFETYERKKKINFYVRFFCGAGNEFQGILLSSIYDFIKGLSATNLFLKKGYK